MYKMLVKSVCYALMLSICQEMKVSGRVQNHWEQDSDIHFCFPLCYTYMTILPVNMLSECVSGKECLGDRSAWRQSDSNYHIVLFVLAVSVSNLFVFYLTIKGFLAIVKFSSSLFKSYKSAICPKKDATNSTICASRF